MHFAFSTTQSFNVFIILPSLDHPGCPNLFMASAHFSFFSVTLSYLSSPCVLSTFPVPLLWRKWMMVVIYALKTYLCGADGFDFVTTKWKKKCHNAKSMTKTMNKNCRDQRYKTKTPAPVVGWHMCGWCSLQQQKHASLLLYRATPKFR